MLISNLQFFRNLLTNQGATQSTMAFRACLKRPCSSEPIRHQTDHRDLNQCFAGARQLFVIFTEPSPRHEFHSHFLQRLECAGEARLGVQHQAIEQPVLVLRTMHLHTIHFLKMQPMHARLVLHEAAGHWDNMCRHRGARVRGRGGGQAAMDSFGGPEQHVALSQGRRAAFQVDERGD